MTAKLLHFIPSYGKVAVFTKTSHPIVGFALFEDTASGRRWAEAFALKKEDGIAESIARHPDLCSILHDDAPFELYASEREHAKKRKAAAFAPAATQTTGPCPTPSPHPESAPAARRRDGESP